MRLSVSVNLKERSIAKCIQVKEDFVLIQGAQPGLVVADVAWDFWSLVVGVVLKLDLSGNIRIARTKALW